ncbi:MAG: HAMP domain-containing protein [Elusimicrobia bacterium]|nr:HAMP domain-containing protein [Candidatus Liberimonas magnetica]
MLIRSKLIILFLAVTLIPIFFISALTFHNYKDSIERVRLAQLQDVAAFKADKIDSYFKSLKSNIEISHGFYNIKVNLPVLSRLSGLVKNKEYVASKTMLDGQLRQMTSVLGLIDIMLVNPEGKVVYSSNPEHYTKDVLNPLVGDSQKAFDEGKKGVFFSDVFLDKAEGNKFAMLVTAPAFDFKNVFIGVIAFEVDMSDIYKLIDDRTGLGITGETLIGKRIDNDVIYLNPIRHEPEAALKKHIPLGGEAGGPIQEAVQGRDGSGQLIDYRGKKVIAAWRPIPALDWGMVAKIDAEEAFSDVTHLKLLVVIIAVIIAVLSGIMAFSIAQSISRPINSLSKGAEIVGNGNLDYRVGTSLKDEIGQLSRTFDKMTSDLKNTLASRNELNAEIEMRKQTELDLKRSNENLEQFAYVASHDLQEPLRMMASYSELLERRYKNKLDADADEFIAYIVNGAKRMQKLINDLLAYSRIGRGEKTYVEIDTESVLERVLEIMAKTIQESKAVITHDKLPVVFGNESNFIQLFQNLIGNAIKFRGEDSPQIHVAAKKEPGEWLFSVKDNGIGIEPQYKDRIFLIFQRLHGRDKYPGTGIGLSICKKIVETEGGRIWLDSEQGKGTTFYFTVPISSKFPLPLGERAGVRG